MSREKYFDISFYAAIALLALGVVAPNFRPVDKGIADQVENALPVTVHIWKRGVCQGSGCIISPDGIVFTAKHVTDGVYGEYTVTLNDGREFEVEAVVEDRAHDVAFLKLKLNGEILPYARLANITEMRVGDLLFIVGSPFGMDNFNSVSLGILSAAQRNLDEGYDAGYGWKVTFQTDATAEPGNSGGPVFNLKGEVVGVLVAVADATVNYSVPVSVFKDRLGQIRLSLELQSLQVVDGVYGGEGYRCDSQN